MSERIYEISILLSIVLIAFSGIFFLNSDNSITGLSVYDKENYKSINNIDQSIANKLDQEIIEMLKEKSTDSIKEKSHIKKINDIKKIRSIIIFENRESIEKFKNEFNIKFLKLDIIQGIACYLTKDQIIKVATKDYVKKISIDRKVETFREESKELLNIKDAHQSTISGIPNELKGINITGKGISIAIIDTGIDYTHPEFNCTEVGNDCIIQKGKNLVSSYFNNSEPKNITYNKTKINFINNYDKLTKNVKKEINQNISFDIQKEAEITGTKILFSPTITTSLKEPNISNKKTFDISIYIGDDIIKKSIINYSNILYNKEKFTNNKNYYNGNESYNKEKITITEFKNAITKLLQECINEKNQKEDCRITFNIKSEENINITASNLEINYSYSRKSYNASSIDDNDHGTHVAGIVHYTAPEAKIYSYKALNNNGEGYGSEIIAAIEASIEDEADIISISLGGGAYESYCDNDPMAIALNKAIKENIVPIAASGNSHHTNAISTPACGKSVVSVGAIDKNNSIAPFSNRGEILDVVSYGVYINSSLKEEGYDEFSGTSMATPFVSGIAALYIQAYKEKYSENPIATKTINSLKENCIDLGDFGKDNTYGYGIPDIRQMISALSYRTSFIPTKKSIELKENNNYNDIFSIVKQGEDREFDFNIKWTNLTSENNDIEIKLTINDEENSFDFSTDDIYSLELKAYPQENINAGTYTGEIRIHSMHDGKNSTIPVFIRIPMITEENSIRLNGSIKEGERKDYEIEIGDDITAITISTEWQRNTTDIDIKLRGPENDYLIITSKDFIEYTKKHGLNLARTKLKEDEKTIAINFDEGIKKNKIEKNRAINLSKKIIEQNKRKNILENILKNKKR